MTYLHGRQAALPARPDGLWLNKEKEVWANCNVPKIPQHFYLSSNMSVIKNLVFS